MNLFQPDPDWYRKYWYSEEPAEPPSRIAAMLVMIIASGIAVWRGWASRDGAQHQHPLYRSPSDA